MFPNFESEVFSRFVKAQNFAEQTKLKIAINQ